MLITTRQKRQHLQKSVLSLRYSDIDIRMSTCDKILGVFVDENLLWNDQFHHITKKAIVKLMAFKQDTVLFNNKSQT